jgi:hypothetical protein
LLADSATGEIPAGDRDGIVRNSERPRHRFRRNDSEHVGKAGGALPMQFMPPKNGIAMPIVLKLQFPES